MSNTTRPTTDAGWLSFGSNLSTLLTSAPADYGVSVDEAGDFKGLFLSFSDLYTKSQEPLTRTQIVVREKQDALRLMAAAVGKLDQRIRGFSGITDAKLMALGFTPRKKPTRKNAPTEVPSLEVKSTTNNVLSIVAHGTSSKRSLEKSASGVTVFSYIGTTPPPTSVGWDWRGNLSRATGEIAFEGTVTGKVWLCAVFYNDRGQGPACAPICVNLAGANDVPSVETPMKLAA